MKLFALISFLILIGPHAFSQQVNDVEIFKPGDKEIDSFIINQTLRGMEKGKLFFFLNGRKVPLDTYSLATQNVKEVRLQHAKSAQKQFNNPALQGVVYVTTYSNTKFVRLSERLVKEELRREEGVEVYINGRLFTGTDAYVDASATIIPAYSKEGDMSFLRKIFVSTLNTEASCDCPRNDFAGTKVDTSFTFTNGKTIALCGYRNTESRPVTFSEFVLAVCGQEVIIDFWDATTTCKVSVSKDTLFVEELRGLPVGKDFKTQETVWTIDRIYFSGPNLVKDWAINRKFRKYNQDEIRKVLKNYETATGGLDDAKMVIVNRLFVATLSGSQSARKCFDEFKAKFGTLDGAFKEEYNELVVMLGLWDQDY